MNPNLHKMIDQLSDPSHPETRSYREKWLSQHMLNEYLEVKTR